MANLFSVSSELLDNVTNALRAYASKENVAPQNRSLATMSAQGVERIRTGMELSEDQIPYFRKRYQEEFVDRLRSFARGVNEAHEENDQLFWLAFNIYALFRERQLRVPTFGDTDMKLFAFFDENYHSFKPDQKVRIDYDQSRRH